jgi:hypothetical protein
LIAALPKMQTSIQLVYIQISSKWKTTEVFDLAQALAVTWKQPCCVVIWLPKGHPSISPVSVASTKAKQTFTMHYNQKDNRVEIMLPAIQNRVVKGESLSCLYRGRLSESALTVFKARVWVDTYRKKLQMSWFVGGNSMFALAMSQGTADFKSQEVMHLLICYDAFPTKVRDAGRLMEETKASSLKINRTHVLGLFFSRPVSEGMGAYERMGLYEHLFFQQLGGLSLCYLFRELVMLGFAVPEDLVGLDAAAMKEGEKYEKLLAYYQSLGFVTLKTGSQLQDDIVSETTEMVTNVERLLSICSKHNRVIDPYVEWFKMSSSRIDTPIQKNMRIITSQDVEDAKRDKETLGGSYRGFCLDRIF